jgi:molybdate transport system substrate-binding protein
MVFAGAASKPPTEEVAKAFEAKTGVKVDISFGGSGTVL